MELVDLSSRITKEMTLPEMIMPRFNFFLSKINVDSYFDVHFALSLTEELPLLYPTVKNEFSRS